MDETAEAEEPGNSGEPKQDVDEGVSEEEDAFLWYKCLEVWWKMEDILPSSSFGPFVKKHPSFSKDTSWNLGFVQDSAQGEKYKMIADKISDTLGFMEAIGISSKTSRRLRNVDFYTS